MISRKSFDRYDKQVRRLASDASSYVVRMVAAFSSQNPNAGIDDIRDFAQGAMCEAMRIYGDASAAAAAEYYDTIVYDAGTRAKPAMLENAVDESQAERVARYQARNLIDGETSKFIKECAAYAEDATKRSADLTMKANAARDEKSGVLFARVPSGFETCTFCRMLASRGFVYESSKSAGEMGHFHRSCDCRIIASADGDGLEGYDPEKELELWSRFEEIDGNPSLNTKERAAAKRALVGAPGPEVVYRKPKSAFYKERGGKNDLAAHETLRAAGHEVEVREEDAPEGCSNIDLLVDGRLCELKSPTSDNSSDNGPRFIERNIRKAIKQFKKTDGGPTRPVIVALNCETVPIGREDAVKRTALEIERHNVDRVLLITRGGVVDDIKRPQGC